MGSDGHVAVEIGTGRPMSVMEDGPGVRRAFAEELFVPTPVASASGHARPFEETYAWVQPQMRRVPITRVTDISPLDPVGLPVWVAVTPLAKDLTTHAGKGRHALAARVSAIMEAIERTSAESIPEDRTVEMAHWELAGHRPRGCLPVDPTRYNLPFDTRYSHDGVFRWVLGYDLVGQSSRWIPVDLVVSPPEEGICTGVETNGLAAGNTYTEATLHAIYELIERYSAMRFDYWDRFGDSAVRPSCMVDPATLPAESRAWVDRIETFGLRIGIRDETLELGVPVFRAIIFDPYFPLEDVGAAVGFGADLNAERAMLRAITEAVQSRCSIIQGARDTFEGIDGEVPRDHLRRRYLDFQHPSELVSLACTGWLSTDLAEDLRELVRRLERGRFGECVVVDLRRADLEVPVVRVVVPDMIQLESRRRPPLRCLASIL